jgi:hypothetical protein
MVYWTLVVMLITTHGVSSISFDKFNSKDKCEEAAKQFTSFNKAKDGWPRTVEYQTMCIQR